MATYSSTVVCVLSPQLTGCVLPCCSKQHTLDAEGTRTLFVESRQKYAHKAKTC